MEDSLGTEAARGPYGDEEDEDPGEMARRRELQRRLDMMQQQDATPRRSQRASETNAAHRRSPPRASRASLGVATEESEAGLDPSRVLIAVAEAACVRAVSAAR